MYMYAERRIIKHLAPYLYIIAIGIMRSGIELRTPPVHRSNALPVSCRLMLYSTLSCTYLPIDPRLYGML